LLLFQLKIKRGIRDIRLSSLYYYRLMREIEMKLVNFDNDIYRNAIEYDYS